MPLLESKLKKELDENDLVLHNGDQKCDLSLDVPVDEEPPPLQRASLRQLWRYASKCDLLMLIVGITVSIATGTGMPLMSIVIGNVSDAFIKMTTLQNDPYSNVTLHNGSVVHYNDTYTTDDFKHAMMKNVYFYIGIGIMIFIAAFLQVSCFLVSGENVTHRTRKHFIYSLLRQDIGWFDKHNTGTLTTKLFDNLERFQEGTGDKVGLMIQFVSQFFAGFIIAFTYDWKLTLIMMSLSPFLIACGMFISRLIASHAQREAAVYAKAGAVAEETLTSIRTVVAFNGDKHECDRYDNALAEGAKSGVQKSFYIGFGLAATFVVLFSSYCLAFWVGTNYIADGSREPKTVLTVFFSVMMGSMALGQAGQQFAVLGIAQGAAAAIFDVIDRDPPIDAYSEEGETPSRIEGKIEIKNLEFSYPTRPDIKILKGVSFKADPGKTIALVGSSGCGKSTIIQLLMRYYTPSSGQIIIDGHEIQDLNIKYLREMIGIVSQEPILFNCTIEENISYGNPSVSKADIVHACKLANAESFIRTLPRGLQTTVGERGTQLSGGQKQRIAIARALVRNPKILLLDEATSALDAESESIVQSALDHARQGRTTIVIAHRLTTIRNADCIIAMKNGEIVETGVHDELMARKGLYHELVSAQVFADLNDEKIEKGRADTEVSVRSRTNTMTSVKQEIAATVVDPKKEEDDLKRLQKELEEMGAQQSNLVQILKHARKQWFAIIIGCTASMISGMVFPSFSILFTEIMTVFSNPDTEKLKKDGHFYALMFLVIGAVQASTLFLQCVCFGVASERLTQRLRSQLFRNIMRMDIAYFDDPKHFSGKLVTRLASDAPNVKSALDFRLGAVFSAVVSLSCGLGIGFYYGWQMTLILIGLFPLMAFGKYMEDAYMRGRSVKSAGDNEDAGRIALEAVENIRTVQALTLEKKTYDRFGEILEGPHDTAFRRSIIQGLSYGFSASIVYFMNAIAFGFGLWLILNHHMTPMHVLKVFFAISFSGGTVGFAAAYFPEYNKAKIAAGIIFKMLSEKPKFDSFSEEGYKNDINGNIYFKNIQFEYPQRPEVKVLRGLDIGVKPGKTLALVGPSGCGKSTVVGLLERFYDPVHGEVVVDGVDLRQHNLRHMRSKIALVSQEPTLFDCSIRENIMYGLDKTKVNDDDMRRATRLANIDDFVTKLPSGYDTRVGEKGTQLSGGQKQRIAIARALIRNPKILLLDEATSALDTESEKIVQEALDRAREGRTCIVIAHRLATIVNADNIAVVKDGVILEQGTHDELIATKGFYHMLSTAQTKKTA
uniref:ABC-type xenobiotic transporter n=1 Tax=Panagrellus redivivus TaxID=6233 RepID=A0A7E4W3A9_PANRE